MELQLFESDNRYIVGLILLGTARSVYHSIVLLTTAAVAVIAN